MTLEQVREDLREIRIYYANKTLFDDTSIVIPPHTIVKKVEKYNKAMQNAPAKLYVLYVSLFLKNKTAFAYADDVGYARDYVRQLSCRLCKYLQEELTKLEKNNQDN